MINPAYLAGVMDSDGSFSIAIRHKQRKNINYAAMCQLTWTKNELTFKFMQDLKNIYGGCICEVQSSNANNFINSKPCYRYMVMSNKALKLINDILPFLVLKRKQARNLIRLQSTNKRNGRAGRSEKLNKFKRKLYEKNIMWNTKNTDRKTQILKEKNESH